VHSSNFAFKPSICTIFTVGDEIFAAYFEKTYLQGRWSNWYVGAAPLRCPNTDNPLKSYNHHGIKNVVNRNRAPLGAWLAPNGDLAKIMMEVENRWTVEDKILLPELSQMDLVNFNAPHPKMLGKARAILAAKEVTRKITDNAGKLVGYIVSSAKEGPDIPPATEEQSRLYLSRLEGGEDLGLSAAVQTQHLHNVRVVVTSWQDPFASGSPELVRPELLHASGRLVDTVRFGKSGAGFEYGIIRTALPDRVVIAYRDNTTEETTPAAAISRLIGAPVYCVICNCKNFNLNGYLCSHATVGLHYQGQLDVVKASTNINFRKKAGRPKKTEGAHALQVSFSQPAMAVPIDIPIMSTVVGTAASQSAAAVVGTVASQSAAAVVGTVASQSTAAVVGTAASQSAAAVVGTVASQSAAAVVGTAASQSAAAVVGTVASQSAAC
jgi:hypothetical protein